MRRPLLALLLAGLLGVEALPLLFVPPAAHCVCVIKSACCRMDVCPMEAARHRPGATPTLASCEGGEAPRIVPQFLVRLALFPPVGTLHRREQDDAFPGSTAERAIELPHAVEEPPPRSPSLVIA